MSIVILRSGLSTILTSFILMGTIACTGSFSPKPEIMKPKVIYLRQDETKQVSVQSKTGEKCKSPGELAKNALVFVHGVLGDAKETWTNTDSLFKKVYWPDLVEEEKTYNADLDKYEILIISYPTYFFKESPNIKRLAEGLSKVLKDECVFPDPEKGIESKYKEVIFVAHSMGNLIVKTSLLTAPLELEITVPLILSIAAPTLGSSIAEIAKDFGPLFFLFNSQFNDMLEIERNSFLSLLNDVWEHLGLGIDISCAIEGKEYNFTFINGYIVEKHSAKAYCNRSKVFADLDHSSIVKPRHRSDDAGKGIHAWLIKELTEKRNYPWKLARWKDIDENKQTKTPEIIIAGKDHIESNIHLAMMAVVIHNKLIETENAEQIKLTRKYVLGTGSEVFSEFIAENIDIYPEYSGALLFGHMKKDPIEFARSLGNDSAKIKKEHEYDAINKQIKEMSLGRPDFKKIEMYPGFGFNNPFELVMLRSKAESLGLIINQIENEDRSQTPRILMTDFFKTVNHSKFVIQADGDLFNRRDAVRVLSKYVPGEELKFHIEKEFHKNLYNNLLDSDPDCTDLKLSYNPYCHKYDGLIIVGYHTDPELDGSDSRFVKVEDDKHYLPMHWAGPLVHTLLDDAFPNIVKPALLELNGQINEEEMRCLIQAATPIWNMYGPTLGKKENEEEKNLTRDQLKEKFEILARGYLGYRKKAKPLSTMSGNNDNFLISEGRKCAKLRNIPVN